MFHLCTTLPENITVAISGGVDSTAVAHYLQKRYKVNLYHFNHGTPQADEMESAVSRFAKDFCLELTVKRTNKKLRTEAEFRSERIKHYLENSLNVVCAHHLGDAKEQFLSNCLQGHLWKIPMRIVSTLGKSIIYRPFLLTTKEQFYKYVQKNNLQQYVVEDKSNQDVNACRRNWLRGVVIPMIEKQNIGINKIVRKQYLSYLKEQEEILV